MNEINVSSNWSTESNNELSKVITCCTTDHEEYDVDNVTTDTCTCLNKPPNNSKENSPIVEIKTKERIKVIDVLSEASLIEVFGGYNEYLFSQPGKFIDDWNGMAVFHTRIHLQGINNCALKFTRTKDRNRLWIYSIHLTTSPLSETSKDIFNFENVNKLINASGQSLSKKAEKFKSFLEIYVKNSSQARSLNESSSDFQILLELMNRSQDLGLNSIKNNWSRHKTNCEEEIGNEAETIHKNVVSEHLKNYFDDAFNKMKKEIMETVDMKLNEMREETNAKLEEIKKLLVLIKERNS